MLKKLLAVLLVVSMLMTGLAFAQEAETVVEHQPVVVLYTNDVHCGIEDAIGYAGLAAYEKAYEKLGYEVILVDNGDAIQGGPIGTLSKGEYIIDIMNAVGYDVATIGNHEFDYGMDVFMSLREKAEFPYISANFCDLEGNTILDPYVIKELGGWKVAFVGASTPETFTKSTPTFFQDAEGNYIYSFCQGEDGANLYAAVQKAVDAARAEGAEIVVVMSHLGTDGSSVPYTSSDLIVNTTGIDAVLDGHSHSVWEMELVQNAAGEDVILSSTGTKLNNVGSLVIEAGEDQTPVLTTALHSESLFQDEEAEAYIATVKAQYEETLNQVVATTAVDLTTKDPATGERAVRTAETNLGDLCADAYRVVLGADVAFVNGGGVRADIPAGDITYGQILSVHPFGNMACLMEVTGQQILDALEMSSRALPDECGGFLQVSGLSYEINAGVESSVVVDDAGSFVEVAGERRVQNVLVAGEPIDPEATYTLASHNYMLKSGGDGLNMFQGDTLLQDEVLIDNQVLINYIVDTLGGVVGEEYADPYGQGRITIVE
ncbi:MAG: bifunctional UDP-sugar hydrolase/5'-nucleotidase [Clostridia bacterium]|nr:bifunctional UDP-sugar hydrolase/5'-nucleotidase [Clostridia bacterium]